MGLRGSSAQHRLRVIKEDEGQEQPALPWEKKGLSRAERVIAFLEFLPVTKGPLAGKSMRLLPDQRRFVEEVYKTGRDRLRKTRIGVQSQPKGNGKTGLVAGLCLCHLLGPEAEPRGEIYSAAKDRQQAALIYAEMEAIIRQDRAFTKRCNIVRWHKRIEVLNGPGEGSIYEAMSADARRAHGLSPTLWAYDELAQAKDRVLLDNLINGLGKRRDALGIVISTQAADDSHPLSQLIDDGLSGADPSIYVQLTAAPEDADPFAEKTWKACNPALGKYLSLKEMREAAERAKRIPAFEPAFRNLRLNQRIDAREDARLVTRQVWQGCDALLRADLEGRACYAGLDLSGKHDLTSLTLVFPDDDGGYDVLPLFWTPEGAMATRKLREQELFGLWIKGGYLKTVPGPVIRYRFMAAAIAEIREKYDLRAIAYDRWRIDNFKIDMADEGLDDLPLQAFGQGFKEMSPAIEYFHELALSGKLRHGKNPVMTAAVTNAIITSDPAGNLKIDKDMSSGAAPIRIDGAVTLVMALGLAKRIEGQPVFDATTMVA